MEQDNKYIRSLIDSAKQGKVVALEELYRMNLNRIYAIIFRMTADKTLACLLTHNVLITAWKNLNNVSEDISIFDWFRMVAVNITYHELRSGKLRKNKKKLKPFMIEKSSDEFYSEPLEKTIAELMYDARSLIVLNRIEGFSFIEIDNLIDIAEDQAKEILVKGMSEIEKSFFKLNPDSGFITSIEELPKEIKPDMDIVHYTMDKIREQKEEEYEEVEIEVEEIEKISTGKVKIEKEKREKRELKVNVKFVLGLLLIIIISIVVYFLLGTKVAWAIDVNTGLVSVNDNKITENAEFVEDDVLKTGNSSEALIIIPNVGKININEQTTVVRVGNNLRLNDGSVVVDTRENKEKLSVEIPSALIDEYHLSDNYILQVDEKGNSKVEVFSGWLEVKSGDESYIIPEGYEMKIIEDATVGIPYLSESKPEFVQLLDDYIFGGKNSASLSAVLLSVSDSDAITLWNLLKKVKPNQRNEVYEKLVELVPAPEGVTKDNILNLDQHALQLWLNEIEWLM